ncbi:MAG: transglutaminase domain-containing protein [Candidatus Aminicenantes bacterium]|nr:MAG: transglutaminase domain-containing protein [Candidatus Aminicenantes bacterium]
MRNIAEKGSYLILILFLFLFLGFSSVLCENRQEEKTIAEYWMGVYLEGVKVGYSHSLESTYSEKGEDFNKFVTESRMRVSRLGGAPIEIVSAQESIYKRDKTPLKTVVRTKMSENEIVLQAEIKKDKILFRSGEKLIKELPYTDSFYLDIPLEKIIQSGDLKEGKKFTFPILDPLSYSIRDGTFEVFGEDDILILGKKMRLRHVRTEFQSIIPVVMEEWIDEKGNIWKSVSQASFMTSTSIRMPKEKALEMSSENLDIAFSTIIASNVVFEDPLEVKEVTFKLSGIPAEKIKNFPFDDGSQTLLDSQEDFALIRTASQVFNEKDSLVLPFVGDEFRNELEATTFCQADDPGIVATARDIIGEEKNAWRAAKKIALWVEREITANYDVGFATAAEILKNREGDCSEHTVIFVALCRAVGIPSRAAVGLMYADGIFAYHMWPEVFVGKWINLDAKWLATDEKTGEFYTDATHIKLGRSNLDENMFEEMVTAIAEIIGKLQIEIIDFCL